MLKLIPFSILLIGLIAMLLWVPPSNVIFVGAFILLVSLLCLYAVSFFSSDKRDYVLAALFGATFLTINWIAGFDVLNTILLICFIIGLKILLK